MAGFTTMAIIAMAVAAGAATTAAVAAKSNADTDRPPLDGETSQPDTTTTADGTGNTAEERPAGSSSRAGTDETIIGPRKRPPGAPILGKAVLRSDKLAELSTPEDAPDTGKDTAGAYVSAYAAGERARKRAAAGASVLTGAQRGAPGPAGGIAKRTLIGS